VGVPANPKVEIHWDRYYTSTDLAAWGEQIARTYPDLVERTSVGRSYGGKDLWLLTLTNKATGPAASKPAIYIDGNIHSNEVQAAEVPLYMAWYLTETYATVPAIRALLDSCTFYIVPTTNPDGRDDFMRAPNTMHSPRSGVQPHDDDRDGLTDEDGFEDLNGDGNITYMRRRSSYGRFRQHPDDPRLLLPVPADQRGDWELLGYEGQDNDGDGDVNEDRTGYMDPNRDWGWLWQPEPIQGGAYKYPFSLPETRAVADFIRSRPNILAALTYHNTGGMLLVGPGAAEDRPTYQNSDTALYGHFGRLGARLLPGYRYINTFEDLYPVYGGQSDWMYGGQGILAYTGELWTPYMMFHRYSSDDGWFGREEDLMEFDRRLLFGQGFVDWQPYDHPQYGPVEIGGFVKGFTRNTPGFQLQEEAHRNLGVALSIAQQLPCLSIQNVAVKQLEDDLWMITADVVNTRALPTHMAHDAANGLAPPNIAELKGGEVLAGVLLQNRDLNHATLEPRGNGARLLLPEVAGHNRVSLRWVVRGSGTVNIEVTGPRGGARLPVSLP
jgi:hypothetical protein